MMEEDCPTGGRRPFAVITDEYDRREILEFLNNVKSGAIVLKPNYLENFGCAAANDQPIQTFVAELLPICYRREADGLA